MNLEDLRTAMVAAATGTDIQEVHFDYNKVLNEQLIKEYPLIVWDIDNMDGTKNLKKKDPGQIINLFVWVGNVILPDADKILAWDSVIADLDAYLLSFAEAEFITVEVLDLPFELFPGGWLSVDREIAVRYKVELKLWC